jgi:hypothetical protein
MNYIPTLLALTLTACAAPQHIIDTTCAPRDYACAQALHNAATLTAIDTFTKRFQ